MDYKRNIEYYKIVERELIRQIEDLELRVTSHIQGLYMSIGVKGDIETPLDMICNGFYRLNSQTKREFASVISTLEEQSNENST